MEELLGQIVSVTKGMWRHRWPALAVSWFIAIVGIVVVLAVPDKYEASARIFVDTQSILKPLMSGLAVQPNVEQQVVMLSRTLISRPNVEKLIRMADLDLGSTSKKAQENLIEKLTAELQIRNTGRDNLYTLAYQDTNPERAKRVVQSLVSIFVESSLGATRKDSDAAKKFIDEQIKSYVSKLEEAESRLKEFRLRNMEMQGADGQDMAGKAAAIAAQLNQARLELREAEKARDSAKQQLENPKLLSPDAGLPNLLKERSVERPVSTPEIDARIGGLKQNLDALLQRFTDRHPDVVNARRLLKDLEEQKKKEVAELRAEMRKAALANPVDVAAPDQSLIRQEIGRMLAVSEVQVAALGARVAEYQSRLARAQELLKSSPQIEAEFAQLNRDYGIHKKNYEDLVSRRESASMSGELEGSSGTVDFRLIDPPRTSQKPVAPNRLLLLPLALIASIGAGLGLAFVLSQLRAVFFDARAVRNTIGLPILGVVTLVRSEATRARESRSLRKFALASSGLLGMFIAAVVVLTVLANRVG